ncbi:MAG TPA: hypothetical protein VIV60_22635 [Polyangiaceae bacterium]
MSLGPAKAKSAHQRFRRLWLWLVLSAILHVPFTPLGPMLGLLTLLVRCSPPLPDEPVEEFVGIPIELLAAPESAATESSPAAPEGDAVVIARPKPKKTKPKLDDEPVDAGVQDAALDARAPDASGDASMDASLADAALPYDGGLPNGLSDAGTAPSVSDRADAGVDAGVTRPDPFAIAGELGQFQKGNVNVRVHFFVEPLARHPAGRVISSLLARDPQWQAFLGPGGLDPLNDFSKIVIMGPQLVDSSQVGVFLEYKRDPRVMRQAVDALVQSTDGAHWETQKKKSVAYLTAAGAERVIILYPNHGVAILPPKPAKQMMGLSQLPQLASPSSDEEILQLMLRTPYRVRAFRRQGVELPNTIELARVFVAGTENGGASIRLELDDASNELATQHAPDLERDFSKLTLGLLNLRLTVEGNRIVGETKLSPLIVATILRDLQKRLAH